MKDQHVYVCNWQCVSLFQREYMDGTQASGLLFRLNVTEVLSLRWGIFKSFIHINEMVIQPSPWTGHCHV